MKKQDENKTELEYILVNSEKGEYYDLGTGDWRSAFNIKSSTKFIANHKNLTFDNIVEHIYKNSGASKKAQFYVESVYKDIRLWMVDSGSSVKLMGYPVSNKDKTCIDFRTEYTKTGSRFFLVDDKWKLKEVELETV